MKELIDKLSLGIIDYENPKVSVDQEEIEAVLMPGELQESSFCVINQGQGRLKGVLYSSSRHLKIKTNMFSGDRTRIVYRVDAGDLKPGETLEVTISIVSNGGEIYLPVKLQVSEQYAMTSLGKINNIFQFADLVQKNYEEALRLFVSSSFEEIFLKNDYILRAKYQVLLQGADKNIAMDEFLIAANKKKAVLLCTKSDKKYYRNFGLDDRDTLVLQKEHWGYLKADITVDSDFLEFTRTMVTQEDFDGNTCEISYVICAKKLRAGNNYAVITITSVHNIIRIPVCVYKNHRNGELVKDSNYLLAKKEMIHLYQIYLSFRMKKISFAGWTESSLKTITQMRRLGKDDVFTKLVYAQLMMTQGKEVEAKIKLEEAEKQLQEDSPAELKCFAYYIRALKERDESVTEEMKNRIRKLYEQGNDRWQLLWFLFYLDSSYDRNESLKMIRTKELYDRGMRSPLMYYEVLMVLNETPSLLRILDAFEKSVIRFGIKTGMVSEKLAGRIRDICSMERVFEEDTFRILTGLYRQYGSDKLLGEITGMLIKGAKTENRYFEWYDLAVQKNLKLTGLYEYYMQSISFEYEGRIPDVVLLYFVYNLTLKGEKLDFLYKKVVEYKEEAGQIYRMYYRIMENYVQESILKGRMNDKLAVVYKDLLKDAVPAAEYLEKLADILNTCMITCDDPAIREVIVIHKEMSKEQRVFLTGQKAYLRIFSEDAALAFVDVHGNRYMKTVSYHIQKLLSKEKLLELCYEAHKDHLGLLIYFCDKYLCYQKYVPRAVEIMEKLIRTADIVKGYKQFLQQKVIEYYASNSTDVQFRAYLNTVDPEGLDSQARLEIIRQCLKRGLYERAFQLIIKYGCTYMDAKLLFRCADKIIQPGTTADENLMEIAVTAFRHGKYNENTLNYISRYYFGSTREMYQIWNAVKRFQCESRELEERIIVQMLFTGEYSNHIGSVFESYIENGAAAKVKRAYLFRKSYDYFVRETVIDEKVFRHIERELLNKEDVHYLCELAWLRYQSDREEPEERQIQLSRKILYEMCERNKKYNFFKKYAKYFPIPEELENKTILEYRSMPDRKILLHYRNEMAEEEYHTEEMRNSCYGIYTKEFVLFHGETIKYYLTEDDGESESIPQSMELRAEQDTIGRNTPYGLLNNMILCREMREENTLGDLMTDYYVKKKRNESIFMITWKEK